MSDGDGGALENTSEPSHSADNPPVPAAILQLKKGLFGKSTSLNTTEPVLNGGNDASFKTSLSNEGDDKPSEAGDATSKTCQSSDISKEDSGKVEEKDTDTAAQSTSTADIIEIGGDGTATDESTTGRCNQNESARDDFTNNDSAENVDNEMDCTDASVPVNTNVEKAANTESEKLIPDIIPQADDDVGVNEEAREVFEALNDDGIKELDGKRDVKESERNSNETEEEEDKPSRRATRSRDTPKSAAKTPQPRSTKDKKTKATPTPKSTRRNAKLEIVGDEEETATPASTSRRSLRSKGNQESVEDKKTPLSRGRKSAPEPEPDSSEPAETVVSSSRTPRVKRSATVKSTPTAAATPVPKKSYSTPSVGVDKHDPYDFDKEMEKHPEPLKHIHVELKSFGEVTYAKHGSGKYEQTEKLAESRVGNLLDLVPPEKHRRSLAELTPGRRMKNSPLPKSAPPLRKGRGRPKKTSESDSQSMDFETASPAPNKSVCRKRKSSPSMATPATKRSQKIGFIPPRLDADEQWTIDHPGDEHAPFDIGARVFALYDKVYYPAMVASAGKDSLGRYKVFFLEDGILKDAPPASIIPLRALVAEKECITKVNDDMRAVQVVRCPNAASAVEWQRAEFVVIAVNDEGETEGDEFTVTWNLLTLDIHEWKEYRDKKSLEASQIVTDNISTNEDRNSRRSKIVPNTEIKSTPTPAHIPSNSLAGGPDTASATPKSTRGRKPNKKKDTPPPTLEAKPAVEPEVESAHLPLFVDMMFILTSAQRPTAEGPSTFKKKLMCDFIVQSQGLVVEDFSEVDNHTELKAFLISDTHYRTHKYLSAMARGVPCVSHEWILKCRDSNSLVDYNDYLLPAGVSILDNQQYPLPSNQAHLLNGKVVLVHTNNQPASAKALNFIQIWEPMVNRLGGMAITAVPEDGSKIDVMLTDASASPELVEAAKNDGATIVSSEWLIQGIIMDELPDVNAHPRFSYNGGAPR